MVMRVMMKNGRGHFLSLNGSDCDDNGGDFDEKNFDEGDYDDTV